MGPLWYWIVAAMLAAYVVLDGFDLGVGILYPLLGRSEADRRTLRNSIGPVWDGNEVWLLAGGGTLFFAFPLVYASSFSGFYLPLMIVLWLLILRGIGLELRGHVDTPVWRGLFDGMFCTASTLLAVFLGAALANVIRGVPLGADHLFFLPLWTNWRVSPQPGILDWYTVLGGLVALVALATHGAFWLSMKTEGELEQRARQYAGAGWVALCALTVCSLAATFVARPATLDNYRAHSALLLIPLLVLASLGAMELFRRTQQPGRAFLASGAYLLTMLVGAAASLYPSLLPSSTDPRQSLTIANALAGSRSLHIGLVWWTIGLLLATMYFTISYRLFRGKVSGSTGYGH